MTRMASLAIRIGLVLFTCIALSSARHHGRHPRHLNSDGQDEHNVCYPGIGCFDNSYPFNNTGEVPQDPAFMNTEFKLFTRGHSTSPDMLVAGNRLSLIQSSFNPRHPVKILSHGFLATSTHSWVINTTRELLRKEPVNVITVDWGRGAGFPYVQAAANTRLVAAVTASLIFFINHETGSTPSQYHLIGHSLGAHISGYIGHRVPGIGRITGLDPAQPNFQGKPPMVRLDPSDAQFVDVIHTDGSVFETLGGFGMIEPVGHLDFYPNGGIQQPGCAHDDWSSFMSSAYSAGVQEAEMVVSCNHNRASELFIESINSHCPFTAYPCTNYNDFTSGNCFYCDGQPCPSMGYSATRGSAAMESVYLLTNPHRPFCGFHYHVELHLGHDMRRVQGVLRVRLHGSQGQTDSMQLHRGLLTPGEIMEVVFVSVSDVGEVEDVHVTYDRIYSYFDYLHFWNTHAGIQIEQLITITARDNARKEFCGSDELIGHGQGTWLTHGMDEGWGNC